MKGNSTLPNLREVAIPLRQYRNWVHNMQCSHESSM
jgi:hypothetical protein